ncbi:MAG: DUF4253 domain-containing protein [bacterium]
MASNERHPKRDTEPPHAGERALGNDDPTTDFVGIGANGARELRPELRALLDQNGVLWDFEEWAAGEVAPACWRSLVPERSALSVWRALRALDSEAGCWPTVIGGPDDEAAHRASLRESLDSTDAILREGLALDVDLWLAEEASTDPDLLHELDGGWPNTPAAPITHHLGDVPFWRLRRAGNATLLWVETPHGWDVPAIVRFGGWNSCPPTHVHVAMLKRWHERFGACLVGLSRDRLEVEVARRPRGRGEALALAREQFLYCDELVLTEHGSLPALAACLLASDVWSFRWD